MKFDFERNDDYQYVIKKGDTLYNIAKEFNVTVDSLLKANGLTSALIYPNQVLIIPLNNNGDVYFVEYVIKDNDTLETVANKYNVTVNDLMNYNNLDKLYLPSKKVAKMINYDSFFSLHSTTIYLNGDLPNNAKNYAGYFKTNVKLEDILK